MYTEELFFLTDRQREVYLLKQQGLSFSVIAKMRGVKPTGVRESYNGAERRIRAYEVYKERDKKNNIETQFVFTIGEAVMIVDGLNEVIHSLEHDSGNKNDYYRTALNNVSVAISLKERISDIVKTHSTSAETSEPTSYNEFLTVWDPIIKTCYDMRQSGMKYSEMARALNLPYNELRKYCRLVEDHINEIHSYHNGINDTQFILTITIREARLIADSILSVERNLFIQSTSHYTISQLSIVCSYKYFMIVECLKRFNASFEQYNVFKYMPYLSLQ